MRDYQQSPNWASAKPTMPDDEVDVLALVSALWRGKFWILLFGCLAVMFGGFYAFGVAAPQYTTKASVALESRQEQVVDIESVMTGLSGDQATINTEVEVLRSRRLIGKLVDDLGLVADPAFNESLRNISRFTVGGIIRAVQDRTGGAVTPVQGLSDQAVRDGVINAVLDVITITNVRQSYVFDIKVVTGEPDKSAAIANRLAELYIADQIVLKFEKTQEATIWLTDRVAELQVALETSESQLKAFSSSTDLVSPAGLLAMNHQLKDLRELEADTIQRMQTADARVRQLAAGLSSGDAAQLAAVAAEMGVLDPVDATINTAARGHSPDDLRQVLARAEYEQSRAKAQLAAISRSIIELAANIETQSEELVALQQLQREAEASRLIYEFFLGRLKETAVQEGLQHAESRILSRAIVPLMPSAPRKPIILALSLILGLIAGTAFVLVREMLQNTFRAPEVLEGRTGLPVLGQIPLVPARSRRKVLQYLQAKPNSAVAEAVRNLRTSLLLSNLDRPPQIIMSTSSVPGEGKTTQSLSLSLNLAGLGKKVLLIEGDIRRRVMNTYFDAEERPGFLRVMLGDVALEEAVTQLPGMPFDVLFGERSQTNAADIFSSETFGAFLAELRKTYDFIVIDTPPVLAVADARIIGRWVDTTIYTVKWDQTTHRQVAEGIKSLEQVGVGVAGLVLGQISPRGMKRYGYGESYATYGAYYEA